MNKLHVFSDIVLAIKLKENLKFGCRPKEFHRIEKECIIDPEEALEPGDMPTNYFYRLSKISENGMKFRKWTIVDVI